MKTTSIINWYFLFCMGVRLCIILRVESRIRVFDNRVVTAIFGYRQERSLH